MSVSVYSLDTEETPQFAKIGSAHFHRTSVEQFVTVLGIASILVLLGAVIFTIIYVNTSSKTIKPTETQNFTLTEIHNSSEEKCLQLENSVFLNGKCKCKENYTGKNCEIEKHNGIAQPIGIPRVDSIEAETTTVKTETKLECSNLCTGECTGFLYGNNTCILFKGKIVTEKVYDSYNVSPNKIITNPTFYVNKSEDLIFKDFVFISEGHVPQKCWLYPGNGYTFTEINKIVKVNFTPKKIIKENNVSAIWSRFPFKEKDVPAILKTKSSSYFFTELPEYEWPEYYCYFYQTRKSQ